MNKIIYSMKLMTQLIEMGFFPVQTMPNPAKPQYSCWVFERSEKFDAALDQLLGGYKDELS